MVSQDPGAWAVGETGRIPSSAQHWTREPGGRIAWWASLWRCSQRCRMKSWWGQQGRESVPGRGKGKWTGARRGSGGGGRGRQCVQDPAAGKSDQTGDRGPGMPDAIVTCQGD